MNVKQIVEKYLKDNGYDGLFNGDAECGCLLEDLCPCGGDYGDWNCEPGYKLPADEEVREGSGFDWMVGPEKPVACDGQKRHHWMVYSTAICPPTIMVECPFCRKTGSIPYGVFTVDEWREAYSAPSCHYHWTRSEVVKT